jgi:uncharacterized protein (TIGR00290 family)
MPEESQRRVSPPNYSAGCRTLALFKGADFPHRIPDCNPQSAQRSPVSVSSVVTPMPEPILFCWSGGKDSAMALHSVLQREDLRVVSLLTTVTEGYERISMHGVRRELLARQSESIGLPLHEVRIPPQCGNPLYEARMEEALRLHYHNGVRAVAFGDIFLEDLRAYRENNLARIGMTAIFPIWKRDTRDLVRDFQSAGFRSIAVCINGKLLDRTFAGRELDASFFRDLPAGIDPCGENGEFHTFVFAGPIFQTEIPFRTGEIVERDSFIFCDLLPLEGNTK